MHVDQPLVWTRLTILMHLRYHRIEVSPAPPQVCTSWEVTKRPVEGLRNGSLWHKRMLKYGTSKLLKKVSEVTAEDSEPPNKPRQTPAPQYRKNRQNINFLLGGVVIISPSTFLLQFSLPLLRYYLLLLRSPSHPFLISPLTSSLCLSVT